MGWNIFCRRPTRYPPHVMLKSTLCHAELVSASPILLFYPEDSLHFPRQYLSHRRKCEKRVLV